MYIDIETTPNPNAKKFILDESFSKYKIYKQYNSIKETNDNPLALKIFSVPGVKSVFFLNDVITINKEEGFSWNEIENNIKKVINDNYELLLSTSEQNIKDENCNNEKINQINKILDETVRPGLAMDGGGLEIIELTDDMKLYVKYHGACGNCPSSTMATLTAITYILRENFDPSIEIIPV
jgi:Fe-S cluster biogenesis protein NfuA